jgi:hypothetical protein
MGHIVTATLIVAKVEDTERYFEKGAVLPEGVSAKERKRLVEAGVIAPVEESPKTDPDLGADAAKAAAEADAKAKAAAEAEAKAAAAAKTTTTK